MRLSNVLSWNCLVLYYARAQNMRSIVSNNRCAHASCRSGTFSPMRAEFDIVTVHFKVNLAMRKISYIFSRHTAQSISSLTQQIRYMYDLCYLTLRDAASGGDRYKTAKNRKETEKNKRKKKKKNKTALTATFLFSMEEEHQGRCAAKEEL